MLHIYDTAQVSNLHVSHFKTQMQMLQH